jgi:hypothetical protein
MSGMELITVFAVVMLALTVLHIAESRSRRARVLAMASLVIAMAAIRHLAQRNLAAGPMT